MGIVCCIGNSCFSHVLPNVIILDIAHINYLADSCFLCAITVRIETKRNKPDKYPASEELFFARGLELNLLFLVPSRGSTFFPSLLLKSIGNMQEKMEWFSPKPLSGLLLCSQPRDLSRLLVSGGTPFCFDVLVVS